MSEGRKKVLLLRDPTSDLSPLWGLCESAQLEMVAMDFEIADAEMDFRQYHMIWIFLEQCNSFFWTSWPHWGLTSPRKVPPTFLITLAYDQHELNLGRAMGLSDFVPIEEMIAKLPGMVVLADSYKSTYNLQTQIIDQLEVALSQGNERQARQAMDGLLLLDHRYDQWVNLFVLWLSDCCGFEVAYEYWHRCQENFPKQRVLLVSALGLLIEKQMSEAALALCLQLHRCHPMLLAQAKIYGLWDEDFESHPTLKSLAQCYSDPQLLDVTYQAMARSAAHHPEVAQTFCQLMATIPEYTQDPLVLAVVQCTMQNCKDILEQRLIGDSGNASLADSISLLAADQASVMNTVSAYPADEASGIEGEEKSKGSAEWEGIAFKEGVEGAALLGQRAQGGGIELAVSVENQVTEVDNSDGLELSDETMVPDLDAEIVGADSQNLVEELPGLEHCGDTHQEAECENEEVPDDGLRQQALEALKAQWPRPAAFDASHLGLQSPSDLNVDYATIMANFSSFHRQKANERKKTEEPSRFEAYLDGTILVYHPEPASHMHLKKQIDLMQCREVVGFDELEQVYEFLRHKPVLGILAWVQTEKQQGATLLEELNGCPEFDVGFTVLMTTGEDAVAMIRRDYPNLLVDHEIYGIPSRSQLERDIKAGFAKSKQVDTAKAQIISLTKRVAAAESSASALADELQKLLLQKEWSNIAQSLQSTYRLKIKDFTGLKENLTFLRNLKHPTWSQISLIYQLHVLVHGSEVASHYLLSFLHNHARKLSQDHFYRAAMLLLEDKEQTGAAHVLAMWQMQKHFNVDYRFHDAASLYYFNGDQEQRDIAVNCALKCLQGAPDFIVTATRLGDALRRLKKFTQAAKVYERIMEVEGADLIRCQVGLAISYQEDRKVRKAEELMEKIVNEYPDNPMVQKMARKYMAPKAA